MDSPVYVPLSTLPRDDDEVPIRLSVSCSCWPLANLHRLHRYSVIEGHFKQRHSVAKRLRPVQLGSPTPEKNGPVLRSN